MFDTRIRIFCRARKLVPPYSSQVQKQVRCILETTSDALDSLGAYVRSNGPEEGSVRKSDVGR